MGELKNAHLLLMLIGFKNGKSDRITEIKDTTFFNCILDNNKRKVSNGLYPRKA